MFKALCFFLCALHALHAQITWFPPANLSAVGEDAQNSQVAVDLAGNAAAVWERASGANNIIQASVKPFQEDWSSPVDLSAAGQSAQNSQVAVDPAGNAVAVWQNFNGPNSIIQASVKPFGGDWSSPVDLSAAGQDAQNPQVAVDPTGNTIAVWQRSNGTNTIIQSSVKPFGGDWSSPVDLSVVGQDAQNPQVAVDPAGNAVAVWQRSNGTNTIIQASVKPFGGDWSSPVDLSASVQDAATPQVAVDPAGNAVAVWQSLNGANIIIQASVKPFGGDWISPIDLSAAGQDAQRSQVAVDPAGNAVAVWQRSNGTNSIIQASVKPFGRDWSIPIDLSAAGQDAQRSQVAIDPAGNAVAVWQRFNGTNTIIQASVKSFGGDWSFPVDLSAAEQDAQRSQVAVDPAGNAVAVWQRFNGTNTIIQASIGYFKHKK